MSVLPPTVLPLVPSAFATGDRVTHRACTLERLASGAWLCLKCGPTLTPKTDAHVRELFVNPACLDALGVPMFSPANVPADAPLPGRPVAAGESPYEVRPYLMCVTGTALPAVLAGVQTSEPGPWGPAQYAFTARANRVESDIFEASMTETGTVYLRLPATPTTIAVTLAYIPAELPTDEEAAAILSYFALGLAFPSLTKAADLT